MKRCDVQPACVEQLEGRTLLSAGDLDPTFGTGGKVLTNLSGQLDVAWAVAVRQDGRIYAAAEAPLGSEIRLGLVCYLPDGSLDTSFGQGGTVLLHTPGNNYHPRALALTWDNKIMVGGDLEGAGTVGGSDFLLMRFNPDGTLDSTFGAGGMVATDFLSAADHLRDMAIDGEGRIVAVGSAFDQASHIAVARYNRDGTLDTSFDGDGKVVRDAGGPNYADDAIAVALQGGKIIAAGQTAPFPVLLRLNTDGSADGTFGTRGDGVIVLDQQQGWFADVAVQSDGRIVGLGSSSNFLLSRFTRDGTIDSTFGIAGVVTMDLPYPNFETMTVQADDKIVLAGNVNAVVVPAVIGGPTPPPLELAVLRYGRDGSLDPTFGQAGVTRQVVNASPIDVALAADSKIVVAAVEGNSVGVYRFQGGPEPTAKLVDGTLTIAGTDGDDLITLTGSMGQTNSMPPSVFYGLDVMLNGAHQGFGPSQIRRIVILGGAGNDAITINALAWPPNQGVVPVLIDGQAGKDVIRVNDSGGGAIVVLGGRPKPKPSGARYRVTGGEGDDSLYCPVGATMLGGAGNDVLESTALRPNWDGGAGQNAFVRPDEIRAGGARAWYDRPHGVLHVRGSERNDEIGLFTPAGLVTAPENMLVGVIVNGVGRVWEVPSTPQPMAGGGHTTPFGKVMIDGRGGNDGIDLSGGNVDLSVFPHWGLIPTGATGLNTPALILGGEGNDTLIGGSAGDTLRGGEGDDVFSTLGGQADRVFGGRGRDTVAQRDPIDQVLSIEVEGPIL